MSLKDYQNKRRFDRTPEPSVNEKNSAEDQDAPLRFVVQMHRATRMHFDFRLEWDGALKSWAVPKGPSLNPLDQRLAVQTEDHPLAYGEFEGVIPKGNYGAGTVLLWDEGTYLERRSSDRASSEKAMQEGWEKGKISFLLSGKKLQGEFALVRLKDEKNWMLIKKKDQYAIYRDPKLSELSVKTGRNLKEIQEEAPSKGDVWISNQVLAAPRKTREKGRVEIAKPKSKARPQEKLPKGLKPMLPVIQEDGFEDENWIFEPLPEGLRTLASAENGSVVLVSKGGLDLRSKHPEVVKSLRSFKANLVLDGVIIRGSDRFIVLDLLHFEGESLRLLPLESRLEVLEGLSLPKGIEANQRFSKNVPEEFSEKTILARHRYGEYQSGIRSEWIKIQRTESQGPVLTHLDKIYFPKDGISKGEVIEYYRRMAPVLLPYLKDRLQNLNRHPGGIEEAGFYHKDMTGYLPRFVETKRIFSESSDKSIDYLLCQNEETLLYMANLGCIEINPWLCRADQLDSPDWIVIDLDPDGNSFDEVMEVALETHHVLEKRGVFHLCKTSGATGIHIGIPTQGKYTFDECRDYAKGVCEEVHPAFPKNTSLERTPAKRRKKIYLDFMQNRRGQTIAAPYCIRPRPGASVSTPLSWDELRPGVRPGDFHMKNIWERLRTMGDLWKPMLSKKQDLG